jgi:phosphoribosylamine--glycine ligase
MRVLLIDQECLGLDFVLRCEAAGHDVRWYMHSPKRQIRDGEGFSGFKIVQEWRSSMGWARDGLIVCTGNFTFLQELDRFRDLGFKIFAPTVKSAELEIVRSKGMEAMQAAGIEVPPYTCFNSLTEAEAFQRKSDKSYVFKTMGSEDDKSLTFVGSDPAQMVGFIQKQIAKGMKLKGQCMLQEKVDMLAEIGVSGWFGPDGFLPGKWQICFEHKKLMNGEIGPNTGEQGTVTQYVADDKMAEFCLKPMESILRVLGHRGDFALGACVDTKGNIRPFEWTARLGWPAFYIQVASHKGDPAQWMRDLLDGKDTLKVSNDVAVGVVMAQPRYPYNASPPDLVEGNPISGIDKVADSIHPASVMLAKGPVWQGGKIADAKIPQTTGEYVLVATGLGKTVSQARQKVYGVVEQVKFKDRMFRTDIGEKLEAVLPKLHKFGFAKQMEYE